MQNDQDVANNHNFMDKLDKLDILIVGDDYYGICGEESLETDYRLGETKELPKARYKFEDFKIQYQQSDAGKNSCSLHAAMGAISDLTGKEFPLAERQKIYDMAVEKGLDPKIGWYANRAVDLLRKESKRVLGVDLMSFTIELDTEDFYKILSKGYSIVFSLKGNKEFQIDWKKDGALDNTKFGASTYGHLLRMCQKDDMYELAIDNYIKADRNIYSIKKANLKELIENKVFGKIGYYFVFKSDYEGSNPQNDSIWDKIPEWATKAVEVAIKSGDTDWSDPNKIVGTSELEEYLIKAGGLTSRLGNVSKVRLVTALYRLNLLK